MSTSILGKARLIFSVTAITVFAALVLDGCGNDDNPGSDGGSLVLGDNQAWVTTNPEDGTKIGVIFQENETLVIITETIFLGWVGIVNGTWSTSGNSITANIDYPGEGPFSGTATYSISGNFLTIVSADYGEPVTLTKTDNITYF